MAALLSNPDLSAAAPVPRLCRLSDLLDDWQSEAEARYAAFIEDRPRGPVSGLKPLDEALGGVLAPGLHIVHGQPGTGKTALGLQIAARCGARSLFVSCEMAALELLRRHTARETGTFLGRLKSGELEAEYSTSLARRAAAAAPELAFVDATRAPASWEYLRDCAQIALKTDETTAPHFLMVVDSLHSWVEGAYSGAPEYEALNYGLARLRQLAHELNCSLLLLCERNRESMKSGGQSAGAGTRKIEYGAETVLDLDCEANAQPNVHGDKAVRVRVTKNRHGATHGGIELLFNGALQKFTVF